MAKRRQKQKGLLTLVVTARQAARATRAAHGRCYRVGNEIFRDHPSDWFHPVGVFKLADEPAASDEQPTPATPGEPPASIHPQEETNVGIATLAKKAAQAVGLVDSTETARYRELRAIIDGKTAAVERHKLAGERLRAALAAHKAGLAEFDGTRVDFACRAAEHEFQAAGAVLARVKAAESEIVGVCPDRDLQRERRRLRAAREQVIEALANIGRRIDGEDKHVRSIREQLAGMTDPRQADDRSRLTRKLTEADTYLGELREEAAALEADRQQLDTDRDELYSRMRAVDA